VSEFSSNPHVFLVKSVNFLKQMLSNPGFVADLEDCIPLKHVAETHEITGLIAFLCMPTSSFMTGQIVCIDGGLTAHGSTPNSFLGA
jgi:Tropinone reductase 1